MLMQETLKFINSTNKSKKIIFQRRKFVHQTISLAGVTMANAFPWHGCAMETKIARTDRTKRHVVSIARHWNGVP